MRHRSRHALAAILVTTSMVLVASSSPAGFHNVVTVSVLTGNAAITDPLDVREYLALFSRLERLAVRGEELQALLKRIAEDHRRFGQLHRDRVGLIRGRQTHRPQARAVPPTSCRAKASRSARGPHILM